MCFLALFLPSRSAVRLDENWPLNDLLALLLKYWMEVLVEGLVQQHDGNVELLLHAPTFSGTHVRIHGVLLPEAPLSFHNRQTIYLVWPQFQIGLVFHFGVIDVHRRHGFERSCSIASYCVIALVLGISGSGPWERRVRES